MKIISSINALREELHSHRKKGRSIGFVPTMGALHDGHLALIKRCRKDNDITVVSIFVNPTQFGPSEDFKSYPRNKKQDSLLAKQAGADIIFYPSVSTMYPGGASTVISVKGVSQGLCGARRPGHFDGVATIVAKLFHIVNPKTAYFGQKDFQQVAVIKKMTADLNFSLLIKTVPTVREKDGLAMSSRNQYLTPNQRSEAAILYRSLCAAKRQILDGKQTVDHIKAQIAGQIKTTSGKIDYIECVDAKTLEPIRHFKGSCLIALAVFYGKARLIDNILLQI